MLTINDLRVATHIIVEGEPYEILSTEYTYKAQRTATLFVKLRNILTGKLIERNFRQSDTFEEAEILRQKARFLFEHRGHYTFVFVEKPSERFTLEKNQIEQWIPYLVPKREVDALIFEEKIRSIQLPIKIHLKVIEAPPGVRGDRAQGGTKIATLETGLQIQTPLFIEAGDVVEVNTKTGQYVQRVGKSR